VLADQDGILDGESGANNFYLYQFQNSTLYTLIAWDKDQAFSNPQRSILDGVTTGANINVLAQALYSFPDYQAVYQSELNRAASLLGGAGGWGDTELTREYRVIRSAALNDPNKQCPGGISATNPSGGPVPCGAEDFEAGVEADHSFLAQRAPFVLSSVSAAGFQPISTNPRIQNVSLYPPGYSVLQLSPGALALATGVNMGPAAQPSSQPLPRTVGNTFVAVDGIRAPLLVTNSGFIGFEVPADLAPNAESFVVVSAGGAMSNTAVIDVWTASPAILTVTRPDGSIAGPGNAPLPNEIVTIYAIGLGSVSPEVTIGAAPPSGTLVTTNLTPQVTLGNSPMNVLFSGLAPGFVGLYQVNAQMPAALPQGSSAVLTLVADGPMATWPLPLQ
jgi:uncharacterized protein (TIGR03437 family)